MQAKEFPVQYPVRYAIGRAICCTRNSPLVLSTQVFSRFTQTRISLSKILSNSGRLYHRVYARVRRDGILQDCLFTGSIVDMKQNHLTH